MSRRFASLAMLLVAGSLAVGAPPEGKKAPVGSLFGPGDFTSSGALVVRAGQTAEIDTGASGREPSITGAVSTKGVLGLSASGSVQVAIFCFDDIKLGDGATVKVSGDRGLVLLSKAGIAVDTVLSVSGAAGRRKGGNAPQEQNMADGGPGGEGGEYGKSFSSAPPPPEGGNGGPPLKDTGQPGRGFGAGFNQRVKGGTPGGGGAYGGAGGDSGEGSEGGGSRTPRPMKGGTAYGDAALADLYGGSGGAGASHDRATAIAGGGAGGGAIALIAITEINIGGKGRVLAEGGAGGEWSVAGGGGSGGAILLAAPIVKTSPGSLVSAKGGPGGTGGPNIAAEIAVGKGRRQTGSGGGGGGGRIAIYTKDDIGSPGKNQVEPTIPANLTLNVDGGNGGYRARDGVSGTIYDGKWPGLK